MIKEVSNDELWKELAGSESLDVVLAYGATCGPCIKTKPHYQMVANMISKMKLNIRFFQIDIWNEENKPFKDKVPVQAVPTFIFLYKGKEITREKGSKEALEIRELIFTAIEIAEATEGYKK